MDSHTCAPLAAHLAAALAATTTETIPFRHWRPEAILPRAVVSALTALKLGPPAASENHGRRETLNATRRFFDASLQARSLAAAKLARALQSPEITALWQTKCGARLEGSYLRIEYCQDVGGFWLEPHTDIGAKRFTMLIYLADPPSDESWGTDLLYPNGTLAVRAAGAANTAVIFVPGGDTWHGFAPRRITGVRRTLIVNYVGPEWRATHELCYPGQPIA